MCPNSQHCIDISTTPINSVRIMYVSARIHFSTANISGSVFCTNLRQLLTEIHTPQWPPQLVQNICSPGLFIVQQEICFATLQMKYNKWPVRKNLRVISGMQRANWLLKPFTSTFIGISWDFSLSLKNLRLKLSSRVEGIFLFSVNLKSFF